MLLLSDGISSYLRDILVVVLNNWGPNIHPFLFKLLLQLDLGLKLSPVILLLLRSARQLHPLMSCLRLHRLQLLAVGSSRSNLRSFRRCSINVSHCHLLLELKCVGFLLVLVYLPLFLRSREVEECLLHLLIDATHTWTGPEVLLSNAL